VDSWLVQKARKCRLSSRWSLWLLQNCCSDCKATRRPHALCSWPGRDYAAVTSLPSSMDSLQSASAGDLPGRQVIEKLRRILLFEADFNFVLKLIWGKRLASTLNPTAFGSENHGSCLRVDAYFSHSVQLPMMPSRATTASSKVLL
jgi:hypothetical protein